MKILEENENSITFSLTWAKTGHDCEDCGLPAVYLSFRYNNGTDYSELCGICAAESATYDAQIVRVM